jgi:F-type H+-transporting ATPase subunit c
VQCGSHFFIEGWDMKKLVKAATVVGSMLAATSAFAEGAEAAATSGTNGMVALASCLAIGVAAFGAATSQGKAVAAALEGIGRNPNAREQLFMPMILGLVFMEFQALMGFIVAFLWYSK